jgi:NAD(P)-dependent dehydrogenase (short-subunit alcohol dehydrogenase family)
MTERKKTALVLGAGGFIGSHMVRRLRSEGYWVRGVDQKYPEYSATVADEFVQGNLTDAGLVKRVVEFKDMLQTSTSLFPLNILILLMRSISMLLIWVVLDLFSVVTMTLRS